MFPLALLVAVALLEACAHIPFWNDHKISDNSVNSKKFKIEFTIDILVRFIFLSLLCFVLFCFFFFVVVVSSFLVSSGTTRLLFSKMAKKPHCYATVVILLTIYLQACASMRRQPAM